jgi:hypothetical protein
VVFSTRFGGSGSDRALSVAPDGSGKVWVVGSTASADFPTKNALQPNPRGAYESCALGNAFVARFDVTTPAIEYSTFLGGRGWDYATSVAVDPEGRLCGRHYQFSGLPDRRWVPGSAGTT